MKEQKIREIIEEKVGEITKLGKKVDEAFDKKTIHDFRVEIKSLRSFLRMLRINNKDVPSRLPEKFLHLYHISGAIREAQLETDKIKKGNQALPSYLEKLSGDLSRGEIEWTMYYTEHTLDKLKAKLSAYSYKQVTPGHLLAFLHLRISEIAALIHKDVIKDEELHEVRKLLKDMIYNLRLAEKKWDEGKDAAKHISLQECERLADRIGDYNDARLELGHLGAFAAISQSAEDKNTIERMIVENTTTIKNEKLEIITAVQAFVNAHTAVMQ